MATNSKGGCSPNLQDYRSKRPAWGFCSPAPAMISSTSELPIYPNLISNVLIRLDLGIDLVNDRDIWVLHKQLGFSPSSLTCLTKHHPLHGALGVFFFL